MKIIVLNRTLPIVQNLYLTYDTVNITNFNFDNGECLTDSVNVLFIEHKVNSA